MAAHYTRILNGDTVNDGDAAEPTGAIDLSDYGELHIFARVSEAGTGESPSLVLEHSSRGESDSYVAFATPVQVDLSETGSAWFHVPAFMRWVAWRLNGSLSSPAVVTLDIVAKP